MIGRKQVTKFALLSGVIGAVVTPLPAIACSPSIPIVIEPTEPPDFRDQCGAAIRDSAGFVAELRGDPMSEGSFLQFIAALGDGTANCPKRSALAFEILDTIVGSPVAVWHGSDRLRLYLQLAPASLSQERKDEVRIGSWLSSSTLEMWLCDAVYSTRLPHGYEENDVLKWLLKPEYWAIANAQFGNNPRRDQMILRQMIDPDSAYFDLAKAAELTPFLYAREGATDHSWSFVPLRTDLEVAEALANPRLGTPDYEAAARIFWWYSPYMVNWTEEELARGHALWLRIAQSRLTDPDPAIRQAALVMLRTGDPLARVSLIPLDQAVPAGAQLVRLTQWPDQLPPLRNTQRWATRIADNYPSRALRNRLGGRVELGIIFAPDGTVHSVHITRSAGDILDAAAQRGFERYMRPRPLVGGDMVLTGYEGRYVYVPLPAIEYRLSNSDNGGFVEEEYKITVFGDPYRRRY